MNMSTLVDCKQYVGFEWLSQRLDPSQVGALWPAGLIRGQIVYVGLRDVDSNERQIIQHAGIKAFTMHDIDRHGIGTVMEHALTALEGRPVHMRQLYLS